MLVQSLQTAVENIICACRDIADETNYPLIFNNVNNRYYLEIPPSFVT